MLRELDEAACPPRIMLHGYGGSPEMVPSLVSIGRSPSGVGGRLYFSFSAVSTRSPKMLARIQAVPDDRLLLESDQTTIGDIDAGLESTIAAIADAKGWTVEQATDMCWANFCRFYDGFLPGSGEGVA